MTDIEMFDYVSSKVEIFQKKEEILWALDRIRNYFRHPLDIIIESGVCAGGNLCMLSLLLKPTGIIIGIDPDIDRADANEDLVNEIMVYNARIQHLYWIRKSFQEAMQDIVDIIGDRKIDLFEHDSIHTQEQLILELSNIAPIMNRPSAVMVHDIVYGMRNNHGYKDPLYKYWNSLKLNWSYEEKRVKCDGDFYGIGLIYLGG
jgi:hypothetical protein